MTRFTSKKDWKERSDQRVVWLNVGSCAYLKIVNLPRNNQEKYYALNDRPPLDARIRRLGGVPVSPFSNQDVFLLVFYGFEVICERTDLSFNRGNNVYGDWLEIQEAGQ